MITHASFFMNSTGFPNYRYSSVAQSTSGRTTPPPVLHKSRAELGSGSVKSPLTSPSTETQKLLDENHYRSTPTRTPTIGSPGYPTTAPAPGRAVRQDAGNSNVDTQQSQQVSEKSSPIHLSNVLNYRK